MSKGGEITYNHPAPSFIVYEKERRWRSKKEMRRGGGGHRIFVVKGLEAYNQIPLLCD